MCGWCLSFRCKNAPWNCLRRVEKQFKVGLRHVERPLPVARRSCNEFVQQEVNGEASQDMEMDGRGEFGGKSYPPLLSSLPPSFSSAAATNTNQPDSHQGSQSWREVLSRGRRNGRLCMWKMDMAKTSGVRETVKGIKGFDYQTNIRKIIKVIQRDGKTRFDIDVPCGQEQHVLKVLRKERNKK